MRKKNDIRWNVFKRTKRKFYEVRFWPPDAKAPIQKSTGCERKRQALSAGAKIVAEYEKEGFRELCGWHEFRRRYETEHLPSKAPKTLQAFQTAANRLESLCGPEWVHSISAEMLSLFALRLRSEGRSEATIQAYRDHLLSALKWAKMVGVIEKRPEPPPLKRIPRGTKSRGRPLTREEAEKMAAKLPSVVGDAYAKRWAWNLEGLWRSGFRIGETLKLSWERGASGHWIENLDGDRPRIYISADAEKGFQNRTIPMAPDFARMLRAVPLNRRKGMVFVWPLSRGNTQSVKTIGKRISALGRAARVVVNSRDNGEIQFATAQDFRRTFGDRWAPKVMPIVLQQLMRHSSIETTLSYYVGINADRTGDALWQAAGDTLGDMMDSIVSLPIEDDSQFV